MRHSDEHTKGCAVLVWDILYRCIFRLLDADENAGSVSTPSERSRRKELVEPTPVLIVVHEQIPSDALRESQEAGWTGCLDGLERHLVDE